MARFHVQPDGNVARCMAASDDTCPFGGMSGANHYATEVEARRAAEKISERQALKGPGLARRGGKMVRPNAKNNLPFVNDALEHLREMHSPKAVEVRGVILDSMAKHSDLEGSAQLLAVCDDLASMQHKPGEGFDSPRLKAYYAFKGQAARIQIAQHKKMLAEKNNRIEEPDVQAVMADRLSKSAMRGKMTSHTAAEINKPYKGDNGFNQSYSYQSGDMCRYDLSEMQESLRRSGHSDAEEIIQSIHNADQKVGPLADDHDRMLQIAASVREMGKKRSMGKAMMVASEIEGRARSMEGNMAYAQWKTQDNSEFIDDIRSHFGESKKANDVFNKSVARHSDLKSVEQLSAISSDINNYLSKSGLMEKAKAGTLTHAEAETVRDLSQIVAYSNKRVDSIGHMQNRVYNNTAVRHIQSSLDQMASDPAMREVNHDIQRIWEKANVHYSNNLVGGGQLGELRTELNSLAQSKGPEYQEAAKAVSETIDNFREEAYGHARRFAPRSLTEAMSSALNKF